MIEFHPSERFSVGMEMEFQLVDPATRDLVDGIMPLMEFYPGSPHVKPEFIQNTVEIASRPCADIEELGAHMNALVAELLARSESLGMQLCGAGTHPFCERLALITPTPRFQEMADVSGLLSHQQITYATHVHVGVGSGDEAVTLMVELKAYLPILIALSANSPYWRGHETGFAAYRNRILASSRNYGMPPNFANWEEFEQFFATMQRAAIFESINAIHWDIRPRPHLGTVEVRVMDAQPTVAEALALAAFIRALVMFLQQTRNVNEERRPLVPLAWWAQKDNCFMASRYGIDALLIADPAGGVVKLRDVACETLERIEPHAEPATERLYLERLRQSIEDGLPYLRQRRIFEQTRSHAEVVRALCTELADKTQRVT